VGAVRYWAGDRGVVGGGLHGSVGDVGRTGGGVAGWVRVGDRPSVRGCCCAGRSERGFRAISHAPADGRVRDRAEKA
jgi:hypothetical protein